MTARTNAPDVPMRADGDTAQPELSEEFWLYAGACTAEVLRDGLFGGYPGAGVVFRYTLIDSDAYRATPAWTGHGDVIRAATTEAVRALRPVPR